MKNIFIVLLLLVCPSIGYGQSPELILQKPHTGTIYYMGVNTANGLLYTFCSKDQCIKIWNPVYGKLIRNVYINCELCGYGSENIEFHLSDNGRSFVITGSGIQLFTSEGEKIKDGEIVSKEATDKDWYGFDLKDTIAYNGIGGQNYFLETSRKKQKGIAVGCREKKMNFQFFDKQTGKVYCSGFGYSAKDMDTLYICDSQLNVQKKIATYAKGGIHAVCTDPKGNIYVAANNYNSKEIVQVWGGIDMTYKMSIPATSTNFYESTRDGFWDKQGTLYTAGANINAKHWDFRKGNVSVLSGTDNPILFNDSVYVTEDNDGEGKVKLTLFDTHTGRILKSVRLAITPRDFFVSAAAANRQSLILGTNFLSGTYEWNLVTNKIQRLPNVTLGLSTRIERSGDYLIFSDAISMGNVRLLNCRQPIKDQKPEVLKATLADISADNTLLATITEKRAADGGVEMEQSVFTLNIQNKEKNARVFSFTSSFSGNPAKLIFSPDGNYLAFTSLSGLMVWKRNANSYYMAYADTASFTRYNDIAFDKHSSRLYYITGLKEAGSIDLSAFKAEMPRTNLVNVPMRILPGDDKIAIFEEGNIIQVLNKSDLAEKVTLIDLSRDEWIAILPDMYYISSHNAAREVGFTLWPRYYTFDQFDLRYNRPDIVAKAMGCSSGLINAYHDAWKKRMERVGIITGTQGDIRDAPAMEVLNVGRLQATTNEGTITITFRASDIKSKIDHYYISLNDIPLNGVAGTPVAAANTFEGSYKLHLSEGANRIQVSCKNANNIYSLKESIYINYLPPRSKEKKTVFIGIGITRYKDTSRNLRYAAKDIADMAGSIKKSIPGTLVYTLIDSNATIGNIKALKQKLRETGIEDRVIVAVCGHGLLDNEKDFYFTPYDCDFADVAKTGISYYDLVNLLDDIPARRKLMLLDACHSGEIDKNTTGDTTEIAMGTNNIGVAQRGLEIERVGLQNTFLLMQDMFSDVSSGNGALIISAARGNQAAKEGGNLANGWFSYSVMQALNDDLADKNQDGRLSVGELKDYVRKKVTEISGGYQVPTTRQSVVDYDWDLK